MEHRIILLNKTEKSKGCFFCFCTVKLKVKFSLCFSLDYKNTTNENSTYVVWCSVFRFCPSFFICSLHFDSCDLRSGYFRSSSLYCVCFLTYITEKYYSILWKTFPWKVLKSGEKSYLRLCKV